MYAEDADSIWGFLGGAEHKTLRRNLTDPASVTSDDNMLFAYDTTTYWSRLSVDRATTAGGSATGEPTQVLINGFYPAPSTGNEWVELYDPTSQAWPFATGTSTT